MKIALTAFALFVAAALTACATDDYENYGGGRSAQDGHHKHWKQRALEPKGGGAR